MGAPAKYLDRGRIGARLPQPDWGRVRGSVYLPRRPTQTPLYPVVQHHLETFLAQAAEADTPGEGVPTWVERDFRGYLECGCGTCSR
jgi:hypothetical protein